jgi:hypothetical protein
MRINILLSLVATTISTVRHPEQRANRSFDRVKEPAGAKEGGYKISFPCDDIALPSMAGKYWI